MRFQSAQVIAYLTDDLWLRLAANSNARMKRLVAGLEPLGVRFVNRPDVNMLFVEVGDDAARAMAEAGMLFYEMGGGVIRLVTSWQTTDDDVDRALDITASALAG
jgi:threonine aldolase